MATPARDATITACLVVYHEESVIDRCLRSLDGVVDEILVIHDGPCRDRTLEIARAHGAVVEEGERVGHAERHRVACYERARSEWLLNIDADEFLSDDLRAHLREMAADPAANGYEVLWRIWDGERYVTERGPYRLAMFRRRAFHFVGHIQSQGDVDPPVVRVPYELEHRPLYNNYTLRTVARKWRPWARINAEEFLTPLETLPQFNLDPPRSWPPQRRILNALSPVLIAPYFVATWALTAWRHRDVFSPREAVRAALYSAIYTTMVQAYVAKLLYLDRLARRRDGSR